MASSPIAPFGDLNRVYLPTGSKGNDDFQSGISGHLGNEVLPVELDHFVFATAPGHHGNVIDVIVRRHRGDGRYGVLGGEFQVGMPLPETDQVRFGQSATHRGPVVVNG